MGNPTMEITTGIGCRIDCRHCPQSRLVARYRVRSGVMKMTFDLFRECLAKMPPDVEIHFSGMSEPWLNGECTRMLLHAAAENRRIAVYTTLQGMTDPDFDAMREVGYEYFTIHVPDAHGNSRIPVDEGYLRFLDRVVRYPLNVAIERQFSCHGALHPAVRADRGGLRIPPVRLHDRPGGQPGECGDGAHRPPRRITCERAGDRLNRNVLLPDGTVLLCCMDYNMDHVLGNLCSPGIRRHCSAATTHRSLRSRSSRKPSRRSAGNAPWPSGSGTGKPLSPRGSRRSSSRARSRPP